MDEQDFLRRVQTLALKVPEERRDQILDLLGRAAKIPSLQQRASPPYTYCPPTWRWPYGGVYLCHYCGAYAGTRDHVVPRSRQGSDDWTNLVPACQACNTLKGSEWPTCGCNFCRRAVRAWNQEQAELRALGYGN